MIGGWELKPLTLAYWSIGLLNRTCTGEECTNFGWLWDRLGRRESMGSWRRITSLSYAIGSNPQQQSSVWAGHMSRTGIMGLSWNSSTVEDLQCPKEVRLVNSRRIQRTSTEGHFRVSRSWHHDNLT